MLHIKHCRDLGFTITAEPHNYYVDYIGYDIVGWVDGRPEWHRAGASSGSDSVDNLNAAEPYLHGDVKWDGCSSWHFDEQDRGRLHGCSRADVQRLGEILAVCWDWTAELLHNFNP